MKNTKTIVIIGALLIVLVVGGAFIFTNIGLEYKLSSQKMLDELQTYQDAVRPEFVVDIINSKDTISTQFIDLRSPEEFVKGHIPLAINIPSHNILLNQNLKFLKSTKSTFILYHNNHSLACGPWMILKQLGLKNVKVLMGGYQIVKNNILKDFSAQTANYKDEKAMYDFAKIVNQTGGNSVSSPATQAPAGNTNAKPATSAKKKSGGGGC